MSKSNWHIKFSDDRRVTKEIKERLRRQAVRESERIQREREIAAATALSPEEQSELEEIQRGIFEKLGIIDEFDRLAQLQQRIAERRVAAVNQHWRGK